MRGRGGGTGGRGLARTGLGACGALRVAIARSATPQPSTMGKHSVAARSSTCKAASSGSRAWGVDG